MAIYHGWTGSHSAPASRHKLLVRHRYPVFGTLIRLKKYGTGARGAGTGYCRGYSLRGIAPVKPSVNMQIATFHLPHLQC